MTALKPAPCPFRLPTFPPDVEAALELLHPIFRECLDPDSTKYDLGSPFISGDDVVATDGRILVWTTLIGRLDLREAVGAIKPTGKPWLTRDRVVTTIPRLDGYHEDPVFPPSLEDEMPCPECEGKRIREPFYCDCCDTYVVGARCNECGGSGRGEREPGGRWKGKPVGLGCDLSFPFVDLLTRHHAILRVPIDPAKTSQVRFWIGEDVVGVVMPLDPRR